MANTQGRYDLYLSYSGRKCYKTCPKQYYFRYELRTKAPRDPRSSMFGTTIGKVMEWFYERRLWASPDPSAAAFAAIPDAMDWTFQHEKWDPSLDPGYVFTLRQDLSTYVPRAVETVRSHGFLTVNSRAEEDLTVLYRSEKHDLTIKLGGRADFVHGNDKLDIWILDGKGSKHREKYVDSDQLIWYAVQFYLKYHVAPTKLGFLFYMFPDDPVTWVAYDNDAMRGLVEETCQVAKKITLKVFDATPSGECHRCDYKGSCDEGTRYLAARRKESGGRIDESVFDLERV